MCLVRFYGIGSEWTHDENQTNTKGFGFAGCLFNIEYFEIIMFVTVVCSLLGNSPASEVYMPTFRNTLSVTSSLVGRCV
jgi:hypothetical protein